jgi:glycosyltransferase involved in cell wall biosynthesis
VLPFTSLTDDTEFVDRDTVMKKYGLKKPFFMVSNQFYKHKDHKTLLNAIAILKAKGIEVLVAMTGKMEDYRDPTYIDELKEVIVKHNISENVNLLGVIPRNEQLSLMRYSMAVIQPSLFEGWSTVVEDVKSIGGAIIASDIEIHKEQLGDQGVFFSSRNSQDLAEKMLSVSENPKNATTSFEYEKHILIFAKSFKNLF